MSYECSTPRSLSDLRFSRVSVLEMMTLSLNSGSGFADERSDTPNFL